jgi:hypothetical protein
MKEGDIVEVCHAGTCTKMIIDEDGTIRPLREGEDGDAVETINLFYPE